VSDQHDAQAALLKRIPIVYEAEWSSNTESPDRKSGAITTALSRLVDTAMMVAEFYEVIVGNMCKPRMYEIDDFMEQRRHSLFRLPANTNRFNPTQLLWVLEALRQKTVLNCLQWE
jgi:hypothetical protein